MRRGILLIVGVTWLAVMAGCAVGPDYEEPVVPIPDIWANAAAADVQGDNAPILEWWTAFGDTVLNNFIVVARDENLDLAMAVSRIREARAYRAIAGGDYWPQVQGSGQFVRSKASEFGPQGDAIAGGALNPNSNWEFGLGASWELDVFGRVRRTVEAANAQFEASVEDYRDVLVSLYAEIATTYVDVRSLQARLELARDNVHSQRETMDIVLAREEAGLVPALDSARARSNLANTESAIPLLETALNSSRNQLSLLMGMAPGGVDSLLVPIRDIPDATVGMAMVMPAELLRRRPDVRRSERQLAAQTARIGVATADLYPSFSIDGILKLEALSFDNLGKSGSSAWSLAPGINWNLFSGGKIRGQIKAEEAKTEQAFAAYHKTVLSALAEVENALVGVKQEEIRLGLLTIAVEASQESVELVHTQYLEGLTDFQSYLDAQRVLFQQQDEWATARGNVFKNVAGLNRALGGGWSLDDPLPDEIPEPATVAEAAPDQEEEVNR